MYKMQSANLEQMVRDFSVVGTKEYELFVGYDNNNNPILLNLNHNPHLLVVGDTRTGKSKLMQQAIVTMVANNNNAEIYISQISKSDLEMFSKYSNVQSIAKNINELNKQLDIITSKFNERQQKISNMIRNFEGDNIYDYNKLNNEKMSCIYLAVDDFGDFIEYSFDNKETKELKRDIQRKIVKLIQCGSSCGIQILISTMPNSILTDFRYIKNLISNKILFRIADNVNARMLSGNTDICNLPSRYFILNSDKVIKGMTCYITLKSITDAINK